jgi:hypothetical protein
MTQRSEFHPLDGPGGRGAVEFVRSGRDTTAVYVVFDGKRVARRDAGTWVSMEPGIEVVDNDDKNGLTVYVSGGATKLFPPS